MRGSNGAFCQWLANCLLGEENLKDYPNFIFSYFYSQSRFYMTQSHSCRSLSTFHLPRKTSFFQINSVESLRILESGSRYTLVQHHLARWTSLFLCSFFHERCQRHHLRDCPTVSETSEFNVKMIQFFLNLIVILMTFPLFFKFY